MNWVQHILVFILRGYQRLVSPVLAALVGPAGRCRFEPSCSQYAIEAVKMHGALKGTALAAWRICRCQPWGGCGHDPVPPKSQVGPRCCAAADNPQVVPKAEMDNYSSQSQVSNFQFKVAGSVGAHACEGSHVTGGRG